MKELIYSNPGTEIYVHKITDTVRVMEQHFLTTGQIDYTLQSLHFDDWRQVNEVNEFINVGASQGEKPSIQKKRYEITKQTAMKMVTTVYANSEAEAEKWAEANTEMLAWENDEVDTTYKASFIGPRK